ncbi:MAG: metalloregulator ArsR/SmtB family transcription factor [Deferrisomatales bacterium]|nr:metalloregulator ArsR/SmtB family transcription factor [Deferrisomatales bacterium]
MDSVLARFKALSDESRLRILWMLEERELCVCEIQAILGLAQSTVSRHLQVLEDSGFVVSERVGPWKNYRQNPLPPPLVQGLLAHLRSAAESFAEAGELRARARGVCREELCGRSVA